MMFERRRRRKVPRLNTTSTADISFMLLIFFLVTTSMDTDKGLSRMLPPDDKDKTEQQSDVEEGKVMHLHLLASEKLLCNDRPMEVRDLRRVVRDFVYREGKSHIIQLQTDSDASYNSYFQIQNELVGAYAELRTAKARQIYGRDFALLGKVQQEKIRKLVPQRISEVYSRLPMERGDR